MREDQYEIGMTHSMSKPRPDRRFLFCHRNPDWPKLVAAGGLDQERRHRAVKLHTKKRQ